LRRSLRSNLQTEQDFLGVGEIADHTTEWRRQLFDQRRRRENLLILGELRILEHVNDLERVLPGKLPLANPPQVCYGKFRPRVRSCDVQFE
jgi:hypothetical protein